MVLTVLTVLMVLAVLMTQALAAPAPVAKPGRATAGAAAVPALAEPAFRLSQDVLPRAYRLALEIDPERPQFSGEIEIDVELTRPTQRIRLHARELRVSAAWGESGARRLAAKISVLGKSQIELRWAAPLPAGRNQLKLAFDGRLSDQDSVGLFRQKVDGRWYAFSDFQPDNARRMAPMFDEPGFKVPWTLSLTVPQALLAVSNTPVAAEEPVPPGRKHLRFATTAPLPSYLLALGVGPFEIVEAGAVGQTPLRILTPQGQAGQAAYAAQWSAPVLSALEAWFGSPHPFAKLDQLAVPLTTSWGAMENPGLVTWSARALLWGQADATPERQRGFIATAAHELAHQWFGNLVTPAWWDDIWLNESFASWLGDRITAELRPDWHYETEFQRARSQAMAADVLSGARQVEQAVANDEQLAGILDSISYSKGQALLAMAEAWAGPAAFQRAVRGHIERHAWGNARSDDFFAALAQADPALAEVLRSFTRQTGVPLLRVALRCESGKAWLEVAQSRLSLLGAPGAPVPALWQLPIQVRSPAGLTRALLDGPEARIALPDRATDAATDAPCPAWVQANVGGAGYYRVAYAPGMAAALLAQPDLPAPELLAGLDDALALNRAGELAMPELLAMVRTLLRHPHADVALAAVAALQSLRPALSDSDVDTTNAYAQGWQAAAGERARSLGWLARPDDDDDARRLRAELVPAMAEHGLDPSLRAQADALARAWLADRDAPMPAATRGGILKLAALGGDAGLFEQMQQALATRQSRNERRALLRALGHFRDPGLAERARLLLLDARFDPRELAYPLMSAQADHGASRAGLLAFVARHHAALVKRMAGDAPAWLPSYFAGGCSGQEAAALSAALGPQARRFAGGQANLAKALEQITLCSAWRQWQASISGSDTP